MKKTFIYAFQNSTSYPDYNAHSGQIVEIVSEMKLDHDEFKMYKIKAEDGWEGEAFEDELT